MALGGALGVLLSFIFPAFVKFLLGSHESLPSSEECPHSKEIAAHNEFKPEVRRYQHTCPLRGEKISENALGKSRPLPPFLLAVAHGRQLLSSIPQLSEALLVSS